MSQSPIKWLPDDFNGEFPPVEQALTEPDGLLAAGGNLKPETILKAYRQGIFPWYSEDQPILWWSPDPRCVFIPDQLHISRSLKKTLKNNPFEIRTDTAFRNVMLACAEPRNNEPGTWINEAMLESYCKLHEMGYGRSVECWLDNKLVGGLYGISIGKIFFGESMFSRENNASKVALHYLCNTIKPVLIDAQVHSKHIESLGAHMIRRKLFIELIAKNIS